MLILTGAETKAELSEQIANLQQRLRQVRDRDVADELLDDINLCRDAWDGAPA